VIDNHSPLTRTKMAIASDGESTREIARKAGNLDIALEKILEEAGLLAAPVTAGSTSAEQRTARVERLRESVAALDPKHPLANKAKQMWNDAEGLRWQLVLSAWDLAEREARRIRIPEMTREDVIGEAAVGLYEAAKRFDPDLGYLFTTYARWWIRAQVKDAVGTAHRIVRLPDSARRQRARLLRSQGTLAGEQHQRPSDGDLARATGLTSRRVARLLCSFSSVSFHCVDDSGHSLEETLADPRVQSPDQQIGSIEDLSLVRRELLRSIEGRYKQIVQARYGLGGAERRTLRELGAEMGISSERVRQLEREALDVLRERLERAHAPATRAVRATPTTPSTPANGPRRSTRRTTERRSR
jgi:RNA polymerase sigma factor (sigma-70 family)